MPFLSRQVARLILVVALALTAAAVWSASASAAFPGIEVTIVAPDGDSGSALLNDISNPENYGTYTIRNRNGTTTSKVVAKGDGISLRQVIEEAEIDYGSSLSRYGAIKIPRPNGPPLELKEGEVTSALHSPTFYVDANGQVWFLRPSTGSGDYNAQDHFRVAGPITLTQTPAELEVTVTASRKEIGPGETVSFTAAVEGGPPGAKYSYKWDFDDGKRIANGGRKESHKFDKEGSFSVLATVTIVGESRSDAGVVKVQVGDPKKSDKDREGGGDNTATGAPNSGTSTGSSGAGSTYDSGSTYTPVPSTPTPPTPTPEPTEPDITTSGTPVEGNLLADASEPPPSNIPESARRAARDGNPQEDANDGDVGVSEAAVSIFAALALLGLGAGMETRQGRLPRLRLPRRSA